MTIGTMEFCVIGILSWSHQERGAALAWGSGFSLVEGSI